MPEQIDGLVGGERQEQGPGILVLRQLFKAAVLVPRQKLLNALRATSSSSAMRAERAMELAPRHFYHPKEIGVPELLGRLGITVFELGNPHADGGERSS